jgi:3-phenylpropionate/cinnamic acid dioxygenase small subunit
MNEPSIADRLAINDVFIRYTTAIDEGEVEDVVACFTDDCEVETPVSGTWIGHEGLRKFAWITIRVRKELGGQFRHIVSNMRIRTDGDTAKMRCYMLDILTLDGKAELLSPGSYDCDFVKRGGEWKIRKRVVFLDTPFSNARWAPSSNDHAAPAGKPGHVS